MSMDTKKAGGAQENPHASFKYHQYPGTPPSPAGGAALTVIGVVMTVALVIVALAMAVEELAR